MSAKCRIWNFDTQDPSPSLIQYLHWPEKQNSNLVWELPRLPPFSFRTVSWDLLTVVHLRVGCCVGDNEVSHENVKMTAHQLSFSDKELIAKLQLGNGPYTFLAVSSDERTCVIVSIHVCFCILIGVYPLVSVSLVTNTNLLDDCSLYYNENKKRRPRKVNVDYETVLVYCKVLNINFRSRRQWLQCKLAAKRLQIVQNSFWKILVIAGNSDLIL